MNHNGNIPNPYNTPEDQHDHHRNHRLPCTPENPRHTVGKSQQKEEKCLCPCLAGSEGNDLGSIIESCNQRRCREIDQYPDDFRSRDGTDDTENSPFSRTVSSPGTQILTDKGSKGQGETGDRKKTEPLYLRVCAAACHSHLSELIDICLHKYIRNRDDGILESGRQSIGENLPQHIPFQADFPKGDPKFSRASKKLMQA